ncbi:nSTAND1 domain-containing NTPase [Kitasatospora kifunensis]|uniref:WD40 repeat protein n=1 Tax=Kitasatospora kifunensis TaxID=58351 RepID=A0A7W7RAW9_KITKI|nr:hypothetical protein [Kitasatospora kifunensis]MBB4928652.1 WD40 repeat protein [Kitasatospora kifunensis]
MPEPDPGPREVRAESISHSVFGDGNTQYNVQIHYGANTWADRPAAAPLAGIAGEIESPYRGLTAFEEWDSPFFFGRDGAAADVLDRMTQRAADGGGLLMVSGVSGAGKSSLLRAGVLPRLRAAGLDGEPQARSWPCQLLTPGAAPLDDLAVTVAALARIDATAVRANLARDPGSFALSARQAALARDGADAAGPGRLLLIVDQFEQLFIRCPEEAERRAFVQALHAAAAPQGALVVLVVREDFEARCTDYPELVDAVQNRYLVTPMTDIEVRAAVTEPARKAGARVDLALVELLVAELAARTARTAGHDSNPRTPAPSGTGLLPHLSHALDLAWRTRAQPELLALSDYSRVGGTHGALARSAQQTYDDLTEDQQHAARRVFLQLTSVADNGTPLALSATREELRHGAGEQAGAVLEAFAGRRLLTLASESAAISHEALLSAWPLLRDDWLAESQADRVLRGRLRTAANEWAHQEKDPAYLYSGTLLAAAAAAAEAAERYGASDERHVPLSHTEQDFLRAAERARTKRSRRRNTLLVGLVVLVLALATSTVTALRATDNANKQRDLAVSGQLAAQSEALGDSDPKAAKRDSLAAWAINQSPEAEQAVMQAAQLPGLAVLGSHTGSVEAVAFSPNGRVLASGGSDGHVRLWNVATGQQIGADLTGHAKDVLSLAFSPDGKEVAGGGADGTVLLWDVSTGKRHGQEMAGHTDSVFTLAFSPDGKSLASGGGDGRILLWDPATQQQIGTGMKASGGEVRSVVFIGNGELASPGEQGTVLLWDRNTQQPIGAPLTDDFLAGDETVSLAPTPDGHSLVVAKGIGVVELWDLETATLQSTIRLNGLAASVALSPDGNTLVSGGGNPAVQVWDLTTGQQLGLPLMGHTGEVDAVAFSPDGHTVATSAEDGTIRLWNTAAYLPTSRSPADSANTVAYSPYDPLVAVGGRDGSLQLLNSVTHQRIGQPLVGHTDDVFSVAFGPKGILASGSADGTVRLWDVATQQQIGQLTDGPGLILSLAFSQDGRTLAAASGDGTVELWNVPERRSIGQLLTGNGRAIDSVAFTPDGGTLVSAGDDGVVRLWDMASQGRNEHDLIGGLGALSSVAISPDGRVLAIGALGGAVRLWDLRTHRQIGQQLSNGNTRVAFSPDGRILATDNNMAGTVLLWDVASQQEIGQPITGDTRTATAVAFSPDGHELAVAGMNEVQFWAVDDFTTAHDRLCAKADPFTPALWHQLVPTGPAYRRVCP